MDHYSLETLAKLHHAELVQQGLHEQAVRHPNTRVRLSNRFKRSLLTILSLIMFMYWLLA
jgi:hypothetical protein